VTATKQRFAFTCKKFRHGLHYFKRGGTQ